MRGEHWGVLKRHFTISTPARGAARRAKRERRIARVEGADQSIDSRTAPP